MNIREFGHWLEETKFWKDGLITRFFDILPMFFIIDIILLIVIFDQQNKSVLHWISFGIGVKIAIILILGIWGYNLERFDLKIVNQDVKVGFQAKIALFSDIHIGRFKDKNWIDRVINETNKIENLDAVLVAGDWTYWPKDISKQGFLNDFAGLQNSRYPIYAVMGNHDVEKPGPKVRVELESALTQLGVKIIDNKSVEFEKWRLVGLEDIWSDKFDGIEDRLFSSTKPNVVLTHQPDIVRSYKAMTTKPIITLTGHTHCGQVRIPFLYILALPTIDAYFDKGWYDVDGGKLFISCGVGEVGLPIRLFNQPTIDVLSFS